MVINKRVPTYSFIMVGALNDIDFIWIFFFLKS